MVSQERPDNNNRSLLLILGATGLVVALALIVMSVVMVLNQNGGIGGQARTDQPSFLEDIDPDALPPEVTFEEDALPPGIPPDATRMDPAQGGARVSPLPTIISILSLLLSGGAFVLAFMAFRRQP